MYKRTYPGQFKNYTFDKNHLNVNWMRLDEELGWVCRDDTSELKFSNKYYNKLHIGYHINSQGYRSSLDFSKQIDSKKKIMLLGDSFLFGLYLENENTLVGQLESLRANYEFYNFGIPGYGIDQMFLTYKKYFNTINPDLIILVYIDEDIVRVLESFRNVEGVNKPSFCLHDDKMVLRVSNDQNLWTSLFHHSYILNKFYFKYLDFFAVEMTKRMIRKIKDSGKELIILRWPLNHQLEWKLADWFYDLSQFCKENKVTYVNLASYFEQLSQEELNEFYLNRDGHPSLKGNKYVAKILNKIIDSSLVK